jgi:hypothetical protein
VFQLKVAVALHSWPTVQPVEEFQTRNRNCGVVQPVAAAVQRIVVPDVCGEDEFGERLTAVHEPAVVVSVYATSGLCAWSVPEVPARAQASTR